jgi:hypothetical protein
MSQTNVKSGGISSWTADKLLKGAGVGTPPTEIAVPGARTILKALTEIQMVPAATGATTITVAGTYYEPAGQGRLTSNAVYKRYIAVKVSAQSNTAGTISVVLRNVTAGTSGAPVTVVIAPGQENVEKAIAATTVTAQPANLGDVFTILVTHTILGSTVTLNSGGMMEADLLKEVTTTENDPTVNPVPGYVSSHKCLLLSGLSTASYTAQLVYRFSIYGANYIYLNIGSPFSTLNTSVSLPISTKIFADGQSIRLNFTAASGQLLLGQAIGISADNI